MQWPVETRSGVVRSVAQGVGLVVTPPRSVLAETSREIDGLLDGLGPDMWVRRQLVRAKAPGAS